jgi:hypothetical protein
MVVINKPQNLPAFSTDSSLTEFVPPLVRVKDAEVKQEGKNSAETIVEEVAVNKGGNPLQKVDGSFVRQEPVLFSINGLGQGGSVQMGIAQRKAAVRKAVNFLSIKHKVNLPTILASDFDSLPAEIKDYAHNSGSNGSDIECVFHNGTIYIVIDKMNSFKDVERVFRHEVLGHYGSKMLFGKEFNIAMVELTNALCSRRMGGGVAKLEQASEDYRAVLKKINESEENNNKLDLAVNNKSALEYKDQTAYKLALEMQETDLGFSQWKQVRSDNFKQFYGDWENHEYKSGDVSSISESVPSREDNGRYYEGVRAIATGRAFFTGFTGPLRTLRGRESSENRAQDGAKTEPVIFYHGTSDDIEF